MVHTQECKISLPFSLCCYGHLCSLNYMAPWSLLLDPPRTHLQRYAGKRKVVKKKKKKTLFFLRPTASIYWSIAASFLMRYSPFLFMGICTFQPVKGEGEGTLNDRHRCFFFGESKNLYKQHPTPK